MAGRAFQGFIPSLRAGTVRCSDASNRTSGCPYNPSRCSGCARNLIVMSALADTLSLTLFGLCKESYCNVRSRGHTIPHASKAKTDCLLFDIRISFQQILPLNGIKFFSFSIDVERSSQDHINTRLYSSRLAFAHLIN